MRLLGTLACAWAVFADPIQFSDSGSGLQSSMALIQNGSTTDIQMQMVAPQSAGWSGIGIGSGMTGALMFVIYPAASGQAVTVSVRSAAGHVMPTALPDIQYQVTNSSIGLDGRMTADFVCYGCTTWPSGKLDLTSSSQSFLYAVGPGTTIRSDDTNAAIEEHAANGLFTGNVANAVTTAPAAAAGGGQAAPLPPPPIAAGSSNTDSESYKSPNHHLVVAHAVLLCLVFYLLLPSGVITLRLPFMKSAAFPSHWMLQTLGVALAISGMIIAIYFSKKSSEYNLINRYHQIIGLSTIGCLITQPIGGILHHLQFKKTRERAGTSYGHIVLGWIIIFLGMLNATFGLVLAENNKAAGGLGAAGIVILLVMLGVSGAGHFGQRKSTTTRRPKA